MAQYILYVQNAENKKIDIHRYLNKFLEMLITFLSLILLWVTV